MATPHLAGHEGQGSIVFLDIPSLARLLILFNTVRLNISCCCHSFTLSSRLLQWNNALLLCIQLTTTYKGRAINVATTNAWDRRRVEARVRCSNSTATHQQVDQRKMRLEYSSMEQYHTQLRADQYSRHLNIMKRHRTRKEPLGFVIFQL